MHVIRTYTTPGSARTPSWVNLLWLLWLHNREGFHPGMGALYVLGLGGRRLGVTTYLH
jgi:hypothetical protein